MEQIGRGRNPGFIEADESYFVNPDHEMATRASAQILEADTHRNWAARTNVVEPPVIDAYPSDDATRPRSLLAISHLEPVRLGSESVGRGSPYVGGIGDLQSVLGNRYGIERSYRPSPRIVKRGENEKYTDRADYDPLQRVFRTIERALSSIPLGAQIAFVILLALPAGLLYRIFPRLVDRSLTRSTLTWAACLFAGIRGNVGLLRTTVFGQLC